MLLYFKCQNESISNNLTPIITVRNILNVLECFLIFIIVYRTESVRKAFKKFLKKIVSKKPNEKALRKLSSLTSGDSELKNEDFNFEEVLL